MNQVETDPITLKCPEIKDSDSEKKGKSRGRSYSDDNAKKYHLGFKKVITFVSFAKKPFEAATNGNSSDEEDVATSAPPKPLRRKGAFQPFP